MAFGAVLTASYAYDINELFTHLELISFAKNPDYFYFFETDLEKDGVNELWIAHNKSYNGGNGKYFHVYRKVGASYIAFDTLPVLDVRLLAFAGKGAQDASEVDDKDKRIITYFKHSSKTGSLVSYKIVNSQIVEHEYKEIEPEGTDKDLFEKMFSKTHNIIQKIPAENFRDFLKQKGISCPTSDKVQVLGADLGGTTGKIVFMSNPKASFAAGEWVAFHNEGGKSWKKLKTFPSELKFVFFENYSMLRKIFGRKFLICMTPRAGDRIMLSVFHVANDGISGFDMPIFEIDTDDVVINSPEDADDYAFIEALAFDALDDRDDFDYQLYPLNEGLGKDGKIQVPQGVKIKDLRDVKEIKLPENNRRTKQFLELWKASEIGKQN